MSNTRTPTELTFTCHYKRTLSDYISCGMWNTSTANETKDHIFIGLASLTAWFNRYNDQYLEDAKEKDIEQKIFTMRVSGWINENPIPAFDLHKVEDCQTFFDKYFPKVEAASTVAASTAKRR